MKLSASYLNSLSVGSHTITATFEDGVATAGFIVKAAEGSGDSDGDTPSAGPADGGTPSAGPADAGTSNTGDSGAGTPNAGPSDAGTPNTGDSLGNAAIVAAVLAMVSCVGLVFARRRMRK